jgi:hypothetical protein
MTTKLKVYNRALRYCSERKIADLTEDREPRRLLDDAWDDGAVDVCLAEAQWKFAIRTVRIDYDPAITTDFGFQYAFSKPTDWVSTSAVCSDEYFDTPLIRYSHENDYWYADIDTIYVKYLSNDATYGNDLSLWPGTFANYVSAYMANEIVDKLTASDVIIARVDQRHDENRLKAKNKDAQNQPQRFPAPGSWSSSRGKFAGRTRDRGNRGSLLG